jgi:UDP-galactopyranose mutase
VARVVVLGAGFGGMAAAARIAKLGHQVTLCEQRDRLGGAMYALEKDGFRWDAGPSMTTLPAVVRDLFRKSGRPLEREVDLVPLAPARRHRFPDGTELDLPAGSRADQIAVMSRALGAAAARSWAGSIDEQAPVWDTMRRRWLETPFAENRLDRATERAVGARRSLAAVAERSFSDTRLRQLAVWHTEMSGSSPQDTPSYALVDHYLERTFGVWSIPGGMSVLTDALARRLAQRNVEVLLRSEAVGVSTPGGKVAEVVLADGTVLRADVVVSGIDPRALFGRLVTHASTRRILDRMDRSAPAAVPPAVTHLGLVGDVPVLAAETVLHGEPLLVVRANGTAPSGHAAWTVLRRGRPNHGSGDTLDVLAARGLDVRANIVARVDRSPDRIVSETSGSPYGVAWSGRETLYARAPTASPVEGLYCVGASAHPGAGLPYVGLGSALAARLIGPAERVSGHEPDL